MQGSTALDRLHERLTCDTYFPQSTSLFYTKIGPQDQKLRPLANTSRSFVNTGSVPFQLNIEFRVGNIEEPIEIYLGGGCGQETPALISGFPCSLVQLKKLHRNKSGTTMTLQSPLYAVMCWSIDIDRRDSIIADFPDEVQQSAAM